MITRHLNIPLFKLGKLKVVHDCFPHWVPLFNQTIKETDTEFQIPNGFILLIYFLISSPQ